MKIKHAVILAGGKSTRMGFDKQKIILKDDYLVFENIKKLKNIFNEVTIVTNTPEFYEKQNVTTIQDIYPGFGPISGLHAALSYTRYGSIYLIAVDMPIISRDYINFIDQSYDHIADGLVFVNDGNIEPMHGIYNKNLLACTEKKIKEGKFRISDLVEEKNFIKISRSDFDDREIPEDLFMNLNNQDQLLSYRNKKEC